MKTLADLKNKQECIVKEILADGILGQRLMDLGLCPDTKILFVRRSPFNDPIHIKIGDYHVALRQSEASSIMVETNG